jgi:hypothetical protein
MNPVSTATPAASTVLLWPPGRDALSYSVTRWRRLKSQAADKPAIPLPTTAISIPSADMLLHRGVVWFQ